MVMRPYSRILGAKVLLKYHDRFVDTWYISIVNNEERDRIIQAAADRFTVDD